ncbi:hypothetical protein TRAPUB_11296, partial [Trametes pubescens]
TFKNDLRTHSAARWQRRAHVRTACRRHKRRTAAGLSSPRRSSPTRYATGLVYDRSL